jgi:hypothetical protein
MDGGVTVYIEDTTYESFLGGPNMAKSNVTISGLLNDLRNPNLQRLEQNS